MGRLWIMLALVACLGFVLCASADDVTPSQWMPGHLIVDFKPSVGNVLEDASVKGGAVTLGVPDVDGLLARYHVTEMRRIVDDYTLANLKSVPDFFRMMLLMCPAETDIMKMADDFSQSVHVNYAEPDLLYKLEDRIPNDPLWPTQFDKQLMNLPRAWEFTTGSTDMIVCAVDGGTYWPHEDFFQNLWVNPGEDLNHDGLPYQTSAYPGDTQDINNLDDDADGKVDDLIGWDFFTIASNCATGEDCDGVMDNNPMGISEHGTHVAGLMGAVGNNGTGVAGVNWNVRIIACRAGYQDRNGNGFIVQSASIPCMTWAVSKGALVINMSYGSYTSNNSEHNAIIACRNNGAIMVAAAGNDGISSLHYPSAYPECVAVGSVDGNDVMSSFSNFGSWVDCYAPGNEVESTVIPGYGLMAGTSMASPNAAGVFALISSLFPTLTNLEIVDLVLNNCRDISAQNPGHVPTDLGHGRIDAALVVASQYPYIELDSIVISGDNDGDLRLESGESANLVLYVRNDPEWSTGNNLFFTVSTDDPRLVLSNTTFTVPSILAGEVVDNRSTPIHVTAQPFAGSGWATVALSIQGDNFFHQERSFQLRLGRPQVLIVADDGSDNYHQFFQTALFDSGNGFDYDVWTTVTQGTPALSNVHEYPIIVWVCGNENANTLTTGDMSMLSQYLDSGKRLLLAGQNIDEDATVSGSSFYSNYLHGASAQQVGSTSLTGVAGDPISGGTSLLLRGGGCADNGNLSPSVLTTTTGGVGFYTYSTGGFGAVRYENSTYKTAYFAFAIEAACGGARTTHHRVVLSNTMIWFGATPTDVNEPRSASTVASEFALKPCYPNPFNPTTTLAFDLPHQANVVLRVFDIQGREVDQLIHRSMPAGSYHISFDGSRLASGMYLAQLQADNFSTVQRMMLVK
jgi:subtilisin family serine protease